MRYIALLAIFATAFTAPAPEHQVVMDTLATYNEHDGNSPHVEVNVYLHGEAPMSDTSSAFRCYYCGNQATNDERTTAVCKTAGGNTKPCGSKEDGVGCVNSKFTKQQFATQCGIVGCISAVQTCSTSSKSKNQEETPVSDPKELGRYCDGCGSQTLNDEMTMKICASHNGQDHLCGTDAPIMTCVNSDLSGEEFQKHCAESKFKCKSADTCKPSSKSNNQGTFMPRLNNKPSVSRRCINCCPNCKDSRTLDDMRTRMVCCTSHGKQNLCNDVGPVTCEKSSMSDSDFLDECKRIGCKDVAYNCAAQKPPAQEETTMFDVPQTTPVEVKVYVNEL